MIRITIVRNKAFFNAQTECGNDLNYAALRFSGGNTKRGRKTKELETEERVYSRVKC